MRARAEKKSMALIKLLADRNSFLVRQIEARGGVLHGWRSSRLLKVVVYKSANFPKIIRHVSLRRIIYLYTHKIQLPADQWSLGSFENRKKLFFRNYGRRRSLFWLVAILLDLFLSFFFSLLLFLVQFFFTFLVLIVHCWHGLLLLVYDSYKRGISQKSVYHYSTHISG